MREIEVIREGYENVVVVLKDAIACLEDAKAAEIAEVVAPIEEKYANRLNDYKEDLARYMHIEYVEDEPVVEDAEPVCEETNLEG